MTTYYVKAKKGNSFFGANFDSKEAAIVCVNAYLIDGAESVTVEVLHS